MTINDTRCPVGGVIAAPRLVPAPNGRISIRQFRRGLHHMILKQRIPSIPGLEVPVLYLAEHDEDGAEKLRPLNSLTDYFVAHSAMSMTWMLERARGLGMLYDYLRQRSTALRVVAEEGLLNFHRVALTQFENHLSRGTVQSGPQGLSDDTGLFWLPRSSPDSALGMVRGFRDFVGWLHDNGYGDRLGDLVEADRRPPATGRDAVRFLYVARFRKEVSFLAHLKEQGRQRLPVNRDILGRDTRSFDAPDHVQFPRKYLGSLFREGFTVTRGSKISEVHEDLTAKLAATLCAFGGLRRSEPLHLWVSDVQRVDGAPTVFLHHPVNARVTHEIHGGMTRQEYLRTFCGMEPRNLGGGRPHAGWKGIKCNDEWWAPLYWLPFDGVEDIFWATFQEYISEVRPRLMHQRRRRGLRDHPFLLVCAGGSNHEGDEEAAGDPYTYAAFGKAWARALGRLRVKYCDEALVVSKRLGTTLHGPRHLYGALLAELEISPKHIQECMHHISPLSQLTYTKPRNEHVDAMLSAAAEKTRRGEIGDLKATFRNLREALEDVRDRAMGKIP